MDKSDKLRTVRFRPYLRGKGPTFTLHTYYLGGDRIGYELLQHENRRTVVLFSGADFRPSPMHAIDSDDSVAALMSFLTLRPGDTDREYFDNYTNVQREYCGSHAEALSSAVYCRFGDR